nr:alpha/beta hydrolase [Streptomyces taklimakanensis]
MPDVRGYGRSIRTDPARHTWDQYVDDVASLMDRLRLTRATVGGTGLDGTIALREPPRTPTASRPPS